MNIKHFVKVEFYQPENGSGDLDVLSANKSKTDVEYALGRWMLGLGSITFTPSARISNLP